MSISDQHHAIVLHFLERYGEDRAAGRVASLDAYQRDYPGFESAIASAFERVQQSAIEEVTPPSPTVEATVGPYRLIRQIGRGGQAAVYLAEDSRLGRRVALKVFNAHGLSSPSLLLRFRREALAASRLNHPGICPIFESSEADGVAFIAMAWVPGESLATRIRGARTEERPDLVVPSRPTEESGSSSGAARSSPVPDEREALWRVVHLVERAARAVHAAHEEGIVHRDIKPGNIMVTPEGDPVLLDFGLARDEASEFGTLTESGDLLGTPAYMAPEQLASGGGPCDRQTDIYGLGATLFECLTLSRPFEAPTREGLYRAILEGSAPDPSRIDPRIPRELSVVVATALERDRGRRYDTAFDFAEDLARVRRDEPIAARPPGVLLRLLRWSRRHPAIATSLVAALVLLLAAVFTSLWVLRRTQEDLEEIQRLADLQALPYLERLAETVLWPATPEQVPEMTAWLEQVEAIGERLPRHRRFLEAQAGNPGWDRERTMSQALLATADRLPGLARDIRERRALASSLVRRSVTEHLAQWKRVRTRIAQDDRFAGLDLPPQIGLVPLGRDPVSKLWEFAHLETGTVPERDEEGELQIATESGIILVLVPGGRLTFGPQAEDPSAPNYDPYEKFPDYVGHHVAEIAPCFVSKYEMTQAQWERLTGSNPSVHRSAINRQGEQIPIPWHPVESATWHQATETLRRTDLRLPSNLELEAAARGGTTTIWSTGNAPDSLEGHANVCDQTPFLQVSNAVTENWQTDVDFHDGHVVHAPIASFAPNPYGLYDVHGNVKEFTSDLHERGSCIIRGGSFRHPASYSRSALWVRISTDAPDLALGIRAARSVRTWPASLPLPD